MAHPWEDLEVTVSGNTIKGVRPLKYNHKDELIIQATFTGDKVSLGYIPNKRYTLLLYKRDYAIQRIDGSGRCPYGSFKAFLESWSDIKNI